MLVTTKHADGSASQIAYTGRDQATILSYIASRLESKDLITKIEMREQIWTPAPKEGAVAILAPLHSQGL